MGYKLKRILIYPDGVTEKQVRPVIPPNYLRFTANTANSTVKLTKYQSPPTISLETSRDGETRSAYTIGNTITLSSVGSYVLFRNTSEADVSIGSNGNHYQFVMTGSIAGSGDINYLINKNSTDTVSNFCFDRLFDGCTSLTTPPEFPATTLGSSCYSETFRGCTNLVNAPSLPATTLVSSCYYGMFYSCSNLIQLPALPALNLNVAYHYYEMFRNCSKIKLSKTQTGEYQTPYRIPTTGTGSGATGSNMFGNTGGTFKGTPSINTTYYTSNEVV